jgi:hypothetical protein
MGMTKGNLVAFAILSLSALITPALPGSAFADVTYTNVAAAAGVEMFTEARWGSGVAWTDLDQDGDFDLLMVDGPGDPVCVFSNNGDGTFTDVAADIGIVDTGWGKSVVPADYDSDGDTDVLVTNYSNDETNRLWRNNGDGTFTDVTAGSGFDYMDESTGACWADYDNDRDLDCYITTYGFSHRNRFMRNDGNDQFTDVAQALGMQDPTGWGYQPGWFDYDNDGDQDLYVGNDDFFGGTPNKLFRNNGDGTFTDVSIASGANLSLSTMGLGIADYDNDNDLDVYMSNIPTGNRLLRNNGDGTFTEVGEEAGVAVHQICWGVDFFDMDHDTWPDAYACAFGHDLLDPDGTENFVFRNNGDGTFLDVSSVSGADNAGVSYCSAWGDYDLDGDLDLAVTNWYDGDPDDLPSALYRNNHIEEGETASDWLQIHVVGTVSNRDAIGARVEIVTDEGTYIREKQAGTSFLSSAQPWIHFGLGSATQVNSITVRWPSGNVNTVNNIAGGSIITIGETDVSSVDPVELAPSSFFRVGPNPFSDAVRFSLGEGYKGATVRIFDASGRVLRSLRGADSVVWDGRDERSVNVAAGIYWARLTREERTLLATRILKLN